MSTGKSNGIVEKIIKGKKHSVTKLLKKCWIAMAVMIIVLAIISRIFSALTPWARHYKGEVESHLSAMLGKPVTIEAMQTGWYRFEPVIKLQQVIVHDQ